MHAARITVLLTVLAGTCAGACASGTEGRIVRVQVAVAGDSQPGDELGRFETRTGWQVTLDRAELALSAIYAFAPEEDPSALARAADLLVPVARAHGGHDPLTGKRVRAELVEPVIVDLLQSRPHVLAEVDAEAGSVAALAIDLARPASSEASELDGQQVVVSGEARRGDERVRFAGGVQVPDEATARRVERAVPPQALAEGATLLLGLRASAWLDEAQFDRLMAAADDQPRAITQDDQVGRALFVGARSPRALSLRLLDAEDSDD